MAATTKERNTARRSDETVLNVMEIPMKAATKVNQGSFVVIDAGYAAPGRTALGLIAVGCALATVDNVAGAAGAKRVQVRRGTFLWSNNPGDLIVQADLGKTCYILDDQTVSKTDGVGTRSAAGKIIEVTAAGVFVESF
jgi:hypothetical protein